MSSLEAAGGRGRRERGADFPLGPPRTSSSLSCALSPLVRPLDLSLSRTTTLVVLSKHRYVFLAAREPASYSGPSSADFPTTGKADLKDRMKFNVAKFMQVRTTLCLSLERTRPPEGPER